MKKTINWGPLNKIVSDKSVIEFILDRPEDSLIARKKGIEKGPKFKPLDVMKVAKQIMALSSDPESLSVQVTLPGNLLVHVVMPPIAPEGPFIRIWKMPEEEYTLDQLCEWKAMTPSQRDYLKGLMTSDQSIIVAGSAGSGKTTLLISMLLSLPADYHLVTIEQYGDLNLKRPRTARFVAPNQKVNELPGIVELAGLSRGDCLALAYAQGAEVLPFIELLRDGHQGLMCISGENIFETLKRLEYKISAHAPWMTLEDIRLSITKAFSHIVFQSRESDGKRRISHIGKLSFEDGEIKISETVK